MVGVQEASHYWPGAECPGGQGGQLASATRPDQTGSPAPITEHEQHDEPVAAGRAASGWASRPAGHLSQAPALGSAPTIPNARPAQQQPSTAAGLSRGRDSRGRAQQSRAAEQGSRAARAAQQHSITTSGASPGARDASSPADARSIGPALSDPALATSAAAGPGSSRQPC